MAATIGIYEYNGAGPTGTSSSGGVRFRNADTAVVDTTNPLVKAAASNVARSFKKSLRLYCTTKSTSTTVSNVRTYVSGSNWGTGIELWFKSSPTGTYSQATVAMSSDTGYSEASGAYGSGSPLSLGTGPYTLTDATVIGHNYLEAFIKATTSGDGTTPAVGTVAAGATITIAWDEV